MAIVTALVRTNWSGTTGGPGLTQLAIAAKTDPHSWDATAAQNAVTAVRALWFGLNSVIPDNIKLDVSPVVDVYNSITGDLVGSYTAATVPSQVVGANAGVFSMASGLKVNFGTGQIRNGRRVRGSLYLVPAGGDRFTTDGLVLGTVRTTVNTAFAQLQSTLATNNTALNVWSRPIPVGKKYGPRDGVLTEVTGFECSEKGAILRGRRD